MDPDLPLSATHEVRDRCICLYTQRAARSLARVFDEALRPAGLTNGQFSLLMSLNRPHGPRISDLVPLLSMDRTTLTAALKPLERRGLVTSARDAKDARARRLHLTDAGREALKAALPIWRATHDRIDAKLTSLLPEDLRTGLVEIA
ncbi:MarR family transcriptional regulator [Algicella marina]|uniref:MarR family transcriptional regulator n=2 Tax=Algicella marina TaxID=2683284 RepID=A0A6P1T6S6_9RHOB|nr:MarR family transcriptional regulator [Algicella marina]